ncbi:LytS/YhcK type 5TM receptor domain-containing protein [Devosia sp. Naph2]|uniref:LytS/YhcK type 5TM receptor domain-containing protein n=1 Tax=Devosia polycyclovorans TaxID=3345148 RepID=UPI0035D006ED
MNIELIFTLLNGCGTMALVAICFGQIERLKLGQTAQSLLQGLLFGTGAVVDMHASVEVLPCYRVDARAIFVAFSAAFAGVPANIVTMIQALVFRFANGGHGIFAAMLGIPVAVLVGLVWRKLLGQRQARLPCLAALAAGASLTLLAVPRF